MIMTTVTKTRNQSINDVDPNTIDRTPRLCQGRYYCRVVQSDLVNRSQIVRDREGRDYVPLSIAKQAGLIT